MDEQKKGGWLTIAWYHRYHILHHALLAATLAALTLALETTSHFASFDIITRIVTAWSHAYEYQSQQAELMEKGYQIQYSPAAAGDRPLVLVIPNLPAKASNLQLSQTELTAQLVRALSDEKPTLLAIGLILEPYIDDPILNEELFGESTPYQPEGAKPAVPRNIDTALQSDLANRRRELALTSRNALDNAIRYAATLTRVVIEAPPLPHSMEAYNDWLKNVPEQSKILLARRLAWLWDMCQIPNVWVATQWMVQPYSDIFVYSRTTPILGNIATATFGGADPGRKTPLGQNNVCSIIKQMLGQSVPTGVEGYQPIFDKIERLSNTTSPLNIETINPNFYENLSFGTSLDFRGWFPGKPINSVLPPGLRGKPVFVGEDFPVVRNLLQNSVPIIDVQAAVFYSNLHALNTLSHLDVFLIDLGIGTLLGFLFSWSWGAYARATDRMDHIPISKWWPKTKAWAWAKLFILPGNLLLLTLLIVIMWWLSNEFFRLGAWINPLPLVIGTSIKGLLGSRQQRVSEVPQTLGELINHHPDVVWQPFVIMLAISLIAIDH